MPDLCSACTQDRVIGECVDAISQEKLGGVSRKKTAGDNSTDKKGRRPASWRNPLHICRPEPSAARHPLGQSPPVGKRAGAGAGVGAESGVVAGAGSRDRSAGVGARARSTDDLIEVDWEAANVSEEVKKRQVPGFDYVGFLDEFKPTSYQESDLVRVMHEACATEGDMAAFCDGWQLESLSWMTARSILRSLLFLVMEACLGGPDGGSFKPVPLLDWKESRFPGLPKATLKLLGDHYDLSLLDVQQFMSPRAFFLYTNGWKGDELPWKMVDHITQRIADMCLAGAEYVPGASFTSIKAITLDGQGGEGAAEEQEEEEQEKEQEQEQEQEEQEQDEGEEARRPVKRRGKSTRKTKKKRHKWTDKHILG